MGAFDRLRQSPLWLIVPSLALAGVIAWVVVDYSPLVFDPSQYPTAQAQASELEHIDAGALEKQSAKQAAAAEMNHATANATMRDGSWKGYAVCGKGNDDGWKPYYVAVTIQVEDGKVSGIGSIKGTSSAPGAAKLDWDASENQSYLAWAIDGRAGSTGVKEQLDAALPSSNAPDGIDTVSGATYSSVAIYNAYVDAMDNAKGAPRASTSSKKSAKPARKAKAPKAVAVKPAAAVGELADGTWTAYAACGKDNEEDWKPYYVGVSVTVKNGKAASIDKVFGSSTGEPGAEKLDWDEGQNKVYLDWAKDGRTRSGKKYAGVVTQIKAAIEAAKSAFSVDAVSGATYSSKAIYSAYFAALGKSAAAAGSTAPDAAETVTVEPGQPADTDRLPDAEGGAEPETAVVKTADAYQDGTFFGYAYCTDEDAPSAYAPYYVFVSIETAGGAITNVSDIYGDTEGLVDGSVYDAHENASYLGKAINGFGIRTKGMKAKLQTIIDEGGEIDIANMKQVDTVSGATWSSRSILDAFRMAADNAMSGTGTSPQEATAAEK